VLCAQALGGVAPVLAGPGYLMPEFIRDQLYDLVANNRYSLMGKRDTCRCSDPKFADRFI
jgi:predicted DCC family thiol-disulfide oxidoreductase YuxK